MRKRTKLDDFHTISVEAIERRPHSGSRDTTSPKRRIIVNKNSTKWMLALGAAALSTLFAPGANAGCGKELASKLSVRMPADQAQEQTAAAAEGPKDSPQTGVSIVGMWRSNVSISGQVIFQAFESFTGDGLEFLNDNGSTLEGNVCFGVWNAPSRNTVKVYHPAWNYDMGGNLIGTVVIKAQITIDPSGNTFKGTVVVATYDLNGNVAAPEWRAALTGKRITVD
jgi:hypothetical protein